MTRPRPTSVPEIVAHGLCIGCGLCEAIAPDRLPMVRTPEGRERPQDRGATAGDFAAVAAACPGLRAEGLTEEETGGAEVDPVWGPLRAGWIGWAADARIRWEGATGGVLTALAAHLVGSGQAAFALHVRADPDAPARSVWTISESAEAVAAACGSRYGPAAPLAGLSAALDRARPFVFVGKPCDVGALRLHARTDPRVDAFCRWRLALVCGGASEFTKTADLLAGWGLGEEELARLSYRGRGNPGPTEAVTRDGRRHATTYNALWDDAGTWRLQHRCKICPDAIGEAADVIACDVWPGGGPTGEDEGFNGVLARTPAGAALIRDAVAAGALVVDRPIGPRDLDDFQPHQVAKKRAVAARFAGLRAAGFAAPETRRLRIRALAAERTLAENLVEARGARRRAREGRVAEPPPRAAERVPGPKPARGSTATPIRSSCAAAPMCARPAISACS